MAIHPYVLYMYKNLPICTFSTPNMSLISQGMPEKSGVSKLLWTVGHPVGSYLYYIGHGVGILVLPQMTVAAR